MTRRLSLGVVWSVFALLTAACSSNDRPTAPTLAKRLTLASLSSTLDIIVNTTSDVADFGGSQQVSDLPGPDGLVSLREAIIAANNTTGPQVIGFNIPASDPGFDGTVFTIQPLTALPTLSGGGTTVDGATQGAFTGNTNVDGPEIVLKGNLAGFVGGGLTISSSSNTINGLVLNGFNNTGILITGTGATGNAVTGCFLGTNVNGSSAVGNVFDGIAILQGATNNTIGGSTLAARNLVSGNGRTGVLIQNLGANNNTVQGNFIGTDVTGTVALGNAVDGIQIGPTANQNLIGGTTPSARNIISGNGRFGVFLTPGSDISNNLIQGNFIGTDVSGTASVGGNQVGVALFSLSSNTIGGTAAGARNIISGNAHEGINSNGGSNQIIQGNFIGTDLTGTAALPNGFHGINLFTNLGPSANNIIGGTTPGAGNLISGNQGSGIAIGGAGSSGNVVQGNMIGTDVSGTAVLGNAQFGVGVFDASGNSIGGPTSGAGNTISGNGAAGVTVTGSAVGVLISRNVMSLNHGLGIDLGADGVTPNHPGCSAIGPNHFMNFPVLTSAVATSSQLVVKGTLDCPNPETVTIEFFANQVPTPGGDPSGYGQGAIFLGSKKPNRQGKFAATLPPVALGTLISATATDANGNTSEFAANIEAKTARP